MHVSLPIQVWTHERWRSHRSPPPTSLVAQRDKPLSLVTDSSGPYFERNAFENALGFPRFQFSAKVDHNGLQYVVLKSEKHLEGLINGTRFEIERSLLRVPYCFQHSSVNFAEVTAKETAQMGGGELVIILEQ